MRQPSSPATRQPSGSIASRIEQLLTGRSAPLPYSLRVVLENLVRSARTDEDEELIGKVAAWQPGAETLMVPLAVDRVVLPDSSGLPVLMDFAALRDAMLREGRDPRLAEPNIRCDLVVDHSLIVDQAGHPGALAHNLMMEYRRNAERYTVFKWAQQAFSNLQVIPPGMGIIHQVHLEYLARVIAGEGEDSHPEFVLGCDSHTPMVNALGVLGWGVGGIDAEAAMTGERYRVPTPRVVGVRLTGQLGPGVTTTDLVLTLTERLRKVGVVGDFVEFTGSGLDSLTVAERATLANMAPEYGATCGFFPVDAQTLVYLRATGRDEDQIARIEAVTRALGLWRESVMPEPVFSELVEIDLAGVEPSVAGPTRPQDRVPLSRLAGQFADFLQRPAAEGGLEVEPHPDHGRLAIAAITSCTNTSNPALMLGAGLLARNAVAKGLRTAGGVKTSMAPGSRVAMTYLERSGLLEPLQVLGFDAVGFGCTTCSGKSGPIDPELQAKVSEDGVVAAAILSGNRNFEGRIHKAVKAAYLASPLLVVAAAIAGRIDRDLASGPLGHDQSGAPVHLADIWPDENELAALVAAATDPDDYRSNYAVIHTGTREWEKLETPQGDLFAWDPASTYIRRPPFFDAGFLEGRRHRPDLIENARALAVFGDSLTTDHVTPSGEITPDTLAGQYLEAEGVPVASFNAYTQRRGNHEVLARATFANPRIRNLLVKERGGLTRHLPDGGTMAIYDAAARYRAEGVAPIIIAGRDYGMGSSRDWAAKGPALLGVTLIIARNFERIHRANLIGMGILPAVFAEGVSAETLGLSGTEHFRVEGIHEGIAKGGRITVIATRESGEETRFAVTADLQGADERTLMMAGGIFPRLYDKMTHDNNAEAEG